MTTASDSFTRANETPVTTPWATVTPLGGMNLTSNALVGTASVARASLYNSGTWGNDQRVDAVIGALSATNNYPEVWVRGSTGGNGYKVYTDGTTGGTAIARVDAGAETTIQAVAVAFANGDTLGIGIVGTTITLYKNGVAQTPTATDATYASGLPGAGAYGVGTIDDWTATDGVGSATVDQEGARLGADDGSESAHTWLAAQDANGTVAVGTAFLVRMLLNGTGDAASASHVLRYQKNGAGGFVPVPVGSGNAEVLAQPTWGAVGTAASGTTSCTPAYPTGITAATSKLFCAVTGRGNTADTVPTMPAGWTRIGGLEDGTGTWGVDTGTRRVDFFQKDVTDGTETGTVTVSLSGTTSNTLRASIFRVEVPSGYLIDVDLGTGADTSNDTSYSASSSTSVALDANRLLVLATAQNLDTGTATSRAVSASGITFGSLTNRADTAVTNGNDHRHIINSVPVSSGSGTVAPTYSYTVSAAASGPTAFLVLRARLAATTNEIFIAPSANIAAGGEATTARLTAPSGKTTADFVTGRRWDDENGSDAIDITVDDYTELEWCINTQSPAVNGDAFEFRVYAGASALDTYTVTPQVTLGAAPASLPPIRIPAARLAPLLHF